MGQNKSSSTATRRKFLGGAAVAGVASQCQMPQVTAPDGRGFQMQSGFGASDILSEYGRGLRPRG